MTRTTTLVLLGLMLVGCAREPRWWAHPAPRPTAPPRLASGYMMTWGEYLASWQPAVAQAGLPTADGWQRAAASWWGALPVEVEIGGGPTIAWPGWPPGAGVALPPTIPCGAHGDVVAEINARRAAGAVCGGQPRPPTGQVVGDATLAQAAQAHSDDMASNGFCAHQGTDGSMPEHRIRRAGWTGKATIGEIAALGYDTPREVVDGWMESPGHCRNIMHPGWRFAGLGNTADAWVVNFSE